MVFTSIFGIVLPFLAVVMVIGLVMVFVIMPLINKKSNHQPMTVVCTKCGASIEKNLKFCTACGVATKPQETDANEVETKM